MLSTYGLGETRSEGSSIPPPQKVRFEDPATPSPPKSSPPLSGLLLVDVDMAFDDGEEGVSGKGNEEQSHDGAGTGSSHAAGDPDSDGSVGSQVAEISAEQVDHELDERRSPPASRPEQDDAGLRSPAQSSQLSEAESSQEVLEMAVTKASGQKESKIAKAKRRRTSSSATEVPAAKEGSPKSDQAAQDAEDSERKRKSQRVDDLPNAPRTRSVSGKGGYHKK